MSLVNFVLELISGILVAMFNLLYSQMHHSANRTSFRL